MKQVLCQGFVFLAVFLAACTPTETPPEPITQLRPITLDQSVAIVAGQTLYVPIYSQTYTWERNRTIDLTATLSIRNTDLTHPIILSSVDYYNHQGQLIRKYLEQPVELKPLSATDFVVNQEDRMGGTGAAFIVDWVAQQQVSAPVVEAILINTSGNQGVSLISPGRVINRRS